MNGLGTTRLIKGDPAIGTIPAVAVTSFAMPGDEQKACDAGCRDSITKPISTRPFLQDLSVYMEQ